jgi:hypothetical protein
MTGSGAELTAGRAKHANIRVAPAVLDAARKDGEALLRDLKTSHAGLSQEEADARLRADRTQRGRARAPARLVRPSLKIARNPLVVLLDNICRRFPTHRRCARRNRDGGHGGAERRAPLPAGGSGGCGRGEAQGHDPRDRHRASGWPRGRCRCATWCRATSSSCPRAT